MRCERHSKVTGLPEPQAAHTGLGLFHGETEPLLQHLLLPHMEPSSKFEGKKKQKADPKGYLQGSLILCGEMGSVGQRTSEM